MPRRYLDAVTVADALADALDEKLCNQDTRTASPTRGAWIDPDTGLAAPSHGGTMELLHGLLAACALAEQTDTPMGHIETLAARAGMAAEYMLACQRPSGLVDLPSCNFDSGPDAAFAVQSLCPLLTWFAAHPCQPLAGALEKIHRFLGKAARGLIGAGFHTPNHRWVMASAMAQAADLLDDFDASEEIEAYLAEGIDQDEDGFFQERSIESYDAVTDLSLLLIARHHGWDGAAAAAVRNLTADRLLLDPSDGVAETCLSRRWGGLDVVPLGLAAPALLAWKDYGWDEGLDLARFLWGRYRGGSIKSIAWLAWALLTCGPVPDAPAPERLLADQDHFFPANGLYRALSEGACLTLRAKDRNWMAVKFGRARVLRTFLRASYFGPAGDFIADRVEHPRGEHLELVGSGRNHPRRPGYELPLAGPVPAEDWEQMLDQRSQRRLPELAWRVGARLADGLELAITTSCGVDRIPAMLAMDLQPGTHLDTGEVRLQLRPGQVVWLAGGRARLSAGNDWIELEVHQASAHRSLHLRDEVPPGDAARVVFGWLTPIDAKVRIRWGQGLAGL
ncbi:MAG: hypothetical protein ACLFUJ_15925 [Phycisphaerae bacterium]